MILNHTDFLEPISKALDGDIVTYYNSNEDDQASWFLKLDKNYLMKWILVSVRGGNYEVYVKDGGQTTNPSTLCRNFSFTGPNYLKRNNKALECYREMTGDTIVIKRRDGTSMRIFEVYPIICPENHYGPDCAKCKVGCISCSPITAVCYQCHGPFYGDFCQHTCPANCLNSMCDQRTGVCEGCHGAFYGDLCQYSCPSNCLNSKCDQANGTCDTCNEGYHGMNCELLITTKIFSERTPTSCNRSCITCNPEVQVCLFCTMHQLFDTCRYKCNEICSGDTCHDLEENCTRNIMEKKDCLDCRSQPA
ncbi:multiple epidermal growth factor-like domains protein 11 isoform X2 [Ostrea edulis]|uniref:multiple epidermal growth factor-like domains protein 11 isoform X2 n=1 Tax=Ostrea edulis TaxID=37623 RepID=UPI0024AE9D63|nr:multiple epidermal growth factor-like domains protein 11 isoform X2 [Ostrea edulis]